ncbi:hypothetical protein PRZ48_003538 [Zasmidium cellare]|uniref:T6SS Phospholipase effector Tle1-like catalytic domain-containing protein n=1 Tax=Zasmidium cellare TaxID=395010 RepID=A0ABR0EWW7_ZASCE|nr:hypothetical protein PRZ48_003538 [Zasmidium cellare]
MEERHLSIADEQAKHQVRLPKKLIVCCDGTWMDRDNGWSKGAFGQPGKPQSPSNVTRIARAILPDDEAKHPQIVYYQAGIGTGLGLYEQLLGGGTGVGLSENIREAYAFLASNYAPRDEISPPDSIFLMGFSRGAFTARSLGGFIAAVGILTRKAMPYFYDCFQDWENAGVDGYEPQFFKVYAQATGEMEVLNNMPKLKSPQSPNENKIDTYMADYMKHLLALGLTQEVQIKCIGVWDTVGALGIPINPLFQRVLALPAFVKQYRWYDTRLSDKVENAFQALALDERRFPFSPAVWELDDGGKTNVKQVWFPGAHSNCGGSYEDYGMANITLAWMMDQLSGNSRPAAKDFDPVDWIRFDDDFIDQCFKHTSKYYAKHGPEGEEYSGWAMGKVYDSNTFPMSLTGATTRTPGRYPRTDYETGRYSKTQMLQNTHESIHSSVRARMDLGGKEVEPKNWVQGFFRLLYRSLTFQKLRRPYHPQRHKGLLPASGGPLEGWRLVDGHTSHVEPNYNIDMSPDGVKQVHWEYAGEGRVSTKVMKEDVFAEKGYEQKLLEHDQAIAEQVMYSNNRWSWFKKPKRQSVVAKTF